MSTTTMPKLAFGVSPEHDYVCRSVDSVGNLPPPTALAAGLWHELRANIAMRARVASTQLQCCLGAAGMPGARSQPRAGLPTPPHPPTDSLRTWLWPPRTGRWSPLRARKSPEAFDDLPLATHHCLPQEFLATSRHIQTFGGDRVRRKPWAELETHLTLKRSATTPELRLGGWCYLGMCSGLPQLEYDNALSDELLPQRPRCGTTRRGATSSLQPSEIQKI